MSLIVAILVVSAQAVAAPQPVAPAPAISPVPAPTKVKEKKICKVDDAADSGTRMAKRICRTADEWNRLPQLGTGRSGFSIAGEAMQSH